MKPARTLMVALGVSLSALALTGLVSVAEAGNATKFLLLNAASDESITNSDAFQDIPGLGGTITVGGRTATCVTAGFSAYFANTYSVGVHLRALVDGVSMQPGQVGDFGTDHSLRTFNFWACGVSPGSHLIQVQWALAKSQGGAILLNRTLIVEGR